MLCVLVDRFCPPKLMFIAELLSAKKPTVTEPPVSSFCNAPAESPNG